MEVITRRLAFGVVMCLIVRFGPIHWDWTRSVMYGFSVIGGMYTTDEIVKILKARKK